MLHRTIITGLTGALLVFGVIGCQSTYKRSVGQAEAEVQEERASLIQDAQATVGNFKEEDPSINRFFENSYGYAVLPNVGKGGFIGGGSHGEGVVFEQGEFAGYTTLTQATVGAQAGGQSFSQIIFFEDQGVFNRFIEQGQRGSWDLTAQSSATLLNAGVGASADYDQGVAVFINPQGGLMLEAAVGGQKFDYMPSAGSVPATVR
jgi:lipid-binding SYLF domain-containing protein